MQSAAVSRSRHLTVCGGVSVCGHVKETHSASDSYRNVKETHGASDVRDQSILHNQCEHALVIAFAYIKHS